MEIDSLNSYQRKYLRGLAHRLNPVVLIGQNGLTDTVVNSTLQALKKHELIKVKFIDYKKKDQKKEILESLRQQTQSKLVSLIGHVAIFFKPHPEPAKRTISLPKKSVHK